MGLINKYIINADRIDVRGMIKELEQFKEDVYKSITNGEKTFLPNGNVKEIGAYKDPGRVTGVLASTAWNILNPDNMIEAPAKVSLVKLNIFTEESIEDLKDVDIEKYNLIIDKIFNDNTGLFVKKKVEPIGYIKEGTQNWWLTIPSKYRARYKEKGIKAWNEFVDEVYDKGLPREVVTTNKKGLQVIAIPADTDIPQWLMPYIDYSTIINNILSPFDAVLAIFKVRTVNEGKSVNSVNRKTKAISNIIKF